MIVGNRSVDVVLIFPKTSVDYGSALGPPFSSLTIAAPLYYEGVNIKIIDQRVDREWDTRLREILKDKPTCCGISAMTGTQISFGIEAAKIIKKETNGEIPIIWGGVHPSMLPEQTVKSQYVDIVCVGEGEETFSELFKVIKNNGPLSEVKGIAFLDGDRFVFTDYRQLINIEELLPTPWDLVNVESYINPDMYLEKSIRTLDIGETSRGCPHRCAYCYNQVVHRNKWRAMTVGKILKMIVGNVNKFNLDGIWFRDDEFCLDINRVAKICEEIIAEGLNISWYTSGARITDILRASDDQLRLMKRSGAYVMRFGAESGSDRVLEFMNKKQTVEQILRLNRRCRESGIKPVYSFMYGIPTETFAEINETIDVFFRLKEENPDASLSPPAQYTAFPGTPLFDIARKMGLKPPQGFEDWANWRGDERDFTGDKLPWYSKKERKLISNLTYINILAYSGSQILSTIKFNNKLLDSLSKFMVRISSKYFVWRLRRKSYGFVPEVQLIIKMFWVYTLFIKK